MKTVIAGSRTITDETVVYDAITEAIRDKDFEITEVVSGTAEGVDTIGENWAEKHDVPITRFPYEDFTDEDSTKPAPLIRNDKMAEYADQAIIIWDGESNGSEYMLNKSREEDLNIHLVRTDTSRLDDWL